jgi:hypothetical protein
MGQIPLHQADVGMKVAIRWVRPLWHARRMKVGSIMSARSYSATYTRARSFKWVIGIIFILAALYACFVNHVNLLDAALLFGIGVILV